MSNIFISPPLRVCRFTLGVLTKMFCQEAVGACVLSFESHLALLGLVELGRDACSALVGVRHRAFVRPVDKYVLTSFAAFGVTQIVQGLLA